MAEFVLKDMVKKLGIENEFEIASAATSTEEIWNGIGNPVYPPAREKLAEHGITCEGKRARQVTRKDFEYYDYVIGMDTQNIRNMTRVCPEEYQYKISLMLDYTNRPGSVSDPWYSGDFEATWVDVNEGCRGLLKHLGF